MLKGKIVGLTAIERSDIEQLRMWRNDTQLRKFFREYRELNSDQQKKWFEKIVINDRQTIIMSIRSLNNKKLLGCCGLVYIDWIHRHAELSIYIGYKNAYIDKIGYAEESCILLLKYGFKELGLNKIYSEIYEFDKQKKVLFEKLGFQKDGILRKNYFYEGRWWNSMIYSILTEEMLKKNKK